MEEEIKYSKLDKLNRKIDIGKITKLISTGIGNNNKVSFAVDGPWGIGKTFIIKYLKEQLENDYFFIYYNAWDNDYYCEPVIAVLDTINDCIKSITKLKIGVDYKRILLDVSKNIGDFLDNIVYKRIGFKPVETTKKLFKKSKEFLKFEKINESFNPNSEVKQAKKILCDSLNRISSIKPVVLIVDELDRCIPSYAINVIERIHHINENVSKIASILCVDSKQLNNLVSKIYGFDEQGSQKYLRKIIDFSYTVDYGEPIDNFAKLIDNFSTHFGAPSKGIKIEEINEFIKNMFANLEMRNTLKIINKTMYIDSLIHEKDETRPLDMMCAELLLSWCVFTYGKECLSEFNKEFSAADPKHQFVRYLQERNTNFNLIYYDKIYEKTFLTIDDLKSIMVYVLLSYKKYLPRSISSDLPTPYYCEGFAQFFLPYLEKIKY